MAEPILSTNRLSRHFGQFRAVDDVSIDIRAGSITGLIGPNGAGKSTFFNLLTGVLSPTSGTVTFDGTDVTGLPPDRRFALGLGRSYQIPRPFARMSVLENVMLAPLSQTGETVAGPFLSRRLVQAEEARILDRALEMLDFVTLAPLADHPAGKISGGQMKILELARLLMGDPKLILLDEPSAGVNPALTKILVARIRELNERGKTFIIIEHDMDFVMRHCDPVVAMAEGQLIFQGIAADARANPQLLDAYLGAPAGD